MKKMNNKGFSLVELIVVVLIMAIIAVALAPQVMKWVENSRMSTDVQNYDSVVEAVNVALTDKTVLAAAKGTDLEVNGTQWTCNATLDTKIQGILGTGWKTEMKFRSNTYNGTYKISIATNGTVSRSCPPDADLIS